MWRQPDPFGATTYTTSVTRDANGNATRITQASGAVTDYAFDALDRLVSVTTHPTPTTSLVTSYALDGSGQPVSRTTGDGTTVSYTYDGLARLTAVAGPSLSVAYAYDAAGRRTSMTDATGTTTYRYDGLGRLTQVAAPGGTLGYAYAPGGDRTALTYPGGQAVSYVYSPGGRLLTVTDWAARTSAYAYTPSGLVSRLAYPSGLVATYGYDAAQRLTDLGYTAAGGTVTLASQHVTLDAEGDRTGLDESALVQTTPPTLATDHFTLTYDGLTRLTALNGQLFGGQSSSETFSYDAATNIASRTGPAATYTTDGANRITGDGTRAFAWDGADRLTQRGSDTFAYDALGRMTGSTVAGPSGAVTRTYAYDGDGLLRSRTSALATTAFLWDTSTAPAPLLVAGSDRVVHGLGPLYLARADGTTLTLVRDALGSVRAEASDAGVITKAFRYAAYGEVVQPNAAVPTLLGFAGELRDPSGLTYLRARWYDPGTGRFMSRDRFEGNASRPLSLNTFAYGLGNPVAFADPSGNCVWCVVGGAAIGGLANVAGYVASLTYTHQTFAWDQAAVAFGTGAVAGAVCTATLFSACAATASAATVVQYGLGPGPKDLQGYVVAATIGLASSPLVFTPYRAPTGGLSRSVFDATRLRQLEGSQLRASIAGFIRSFMASVLSGAIQQVAGSDELVQVLDGGTSEGK